MPPRPTSTLLRDLATRRSGMITYGITPPKRSWDPDRIQRVAQRQVARIDALRVDGVVVYDLQDESARADAARPFPYEEPLDPVSYAHDLLGPVDLPKIVYRCVARLDEPALVASLDRLRDRGDATVFVGAASRGQVATMRLPEAYAVRNARYQDVPVGGVLIGERHRRARAEHDRVLTKVDAGCSFFVTQAVYAPGATKDVLGDLVARCASEDRPLPPVLITLTPCGSERTLTFLKWLGIEIPRWIEDDLLRAEDTLAASLDACEAAFRELWEDARAHGIPLGCNVESVSLARAEIEASVELVRRVRAVMG